MNQLHFVTIKVPFHGLSAFRDKVLRLPAPPENADTNLGLDFGYEIHAWLNAAFPRLRVQPWRYSIEWETSPNSDQLKSVFEVYGYSEFDSNELRSRMERFGDPACLDVIHGDFDRIRSQTVPRYQKGQRLRFAIRCCPVARRTRERVERDVYDLHSNGTPPSLPREEVYREWLTERLERTGAAKVRLVEMLTYAPVLQLRKTQAPPGRRRCRWIERPLAHMHGEFIVDNPSAFRAMLKRGVGRHKAFGYGMVWIWGE